MPVGETFQYLKHLSFAFDMDTAQVVGVEGKGEDAEVQALHLCLASCVVPL